MLVDDGQLILNVLNMVKWDTSPTCLLVGFNNLLYRRVMMANGQGYLIYWDLADDIQTDDVQAILVR